ncbi:putative Lectin_legB domain-containing protein [Pseudomonas sp. IT-P12]|uniref:hypothetical protein n=1 Tax=Pseudomonas sp. IT-P12 TaxID=3026450 RepID=UPI0039DF3C1D
MLVIPTIAERQNLKKQLNNNRLGTFTATLEVTPFDFRADVAHLHYDDLKRYNIQAYIDTPDHLYSFGMFIPRNAEEGTIRVSTNPYSETTVYVAYLAAVDGGLKYFIGASGFVNYQYFPAERRIQGQFEYRDVLGKTFKGAFNVHEES